MPRSSTATRALQEAHDQLEQRVEQRTEELRNEIIERMRAEEDLQKSLSLVNATLESTADGILVTDGAGRIVVTNRKFSDMWNIPDHITASGDEKRSSPMFSSNWRIPEEFLRSVNDLYAHPEAESFDTLRFKDGRVFERFSQPQRVADAIIGRVWSFRDVTERQRAQEELQRAKENAEAASRAKSEFLANMSATKYALP